jgi:hypothetical protein
LPIADCQLALYLGRQSEIDNRQLAMIWACLTIRVDNNLIPETAMNQLNRNVFALIGLAVILFMPAQVFAQNSPVILEGAQLTRVVPTGFYFQGLSAPTQMRNSAAARMGENRYVLAGLVDTSGYSADIRAKYEGFLITDSAISINGSDVATGAYGFGFTNDGKLNILDLAGNQILSVSTTKDSALKRPRPLMMMKSGEELRLYNGRDYALITFK